MRKSRNCSSVVAGIQETREMDDKAWCCQKQFLEPRLKPASPLSPSPPPTHVKQNAVCVSMFLSLPCPLSFYHTQHKALPQHAMFLMTPA